MVSIKFIPKDKLLFELWYYARKSQYSVDPDNLTLKRINQDLLFMIKNKRRLEVTTYHSRLLFIDITDDTVDTLNYNVHNGYGTAEKIIALLKLEEMENSILSYYKC